MNDDYGVSNQIPGGYSIMEIVVNNMRMYSISKQASPGILYYMDLF